MGFLPGARAGALAVALGVVLQPGTARAAIEAYAWPASVIQGQSVGIYISSASDPVTVEIFREGATSVRVFNAVVQGIEVQPVSPNAWSAGAGWFPSVSIAVPSFWASGVYTVRCSAGAESGWAIFTVLEDAPGSASPLLVQLAVTTWQAYNAWGGKSLYEYNSTAGVRSFEVSFRRPYDAYGGKGQLPVWELPFIRWLEGSGYTAEYCTSLDLERDPGLLSHYQAFVSVGHDEYWSKGMRDQVEGHIAAHGNAAFLSGNVCWWQVRFSPGRDRMICYKSKSYDPLYGVDNARVTVKWHDAPVFRPENAMTGVSSLHGGYVDSQGWFPASEGYGGYTAYDTGHWAFSGTGLAEGAVFGRESTVVGYETDGTPFTWSGGLPVVAAADQTPLSFRILGLSPASRGYATLGVYERGGTVFTAATTDWSHGLGVDPVVSHITKNVLDALLGISGALLQNDPPIVVSLGDQRNAPGRAIDLPFTAFDPEMGSLNFTASGLPPGLTVDPGSPVIRGSIAADAEDGSPYAVQIRVTDDGDPSRSTLAIWSWEVDTALGAGDGEAGFPEPRLRAPQPNPMRTATSIPFALAQPAAVDLHVVDLEGRIVRVLEQGAPYGAGNHEVRWDARDAMGRRVAPGIYLIALGAAGPDGTAIHRETQKLVVLDR